MTESDLTSETGEPADRADGRAPAEVELARSEQVQAALYRIAETASAAQDMQEFYAEIHRIVGELMYADNFYIVSSSACAGRFPRCGARSAGGSGGEALHAAGASRSRSARETRRE